MSQRYDKIKRPKLQHTQLGILIIYTFARKFSREPWVQERALQALHSTCLWEYTQKLSGSRKAAVGA